MKGGGWREGVDEEHNRKEMKREKNQLHEKQKKKEI